MFTSSPPRVCRSRSRLEPHQQGLLSSICEGRVEQSRSITSAILLKTLLYPCSYKAVQAATSNCLLLSGTLCQGNGHEGRCCGTSKLVPADRDFGGYAGHEHFGDVLQVPPQFHHLLPPLPRLNHIINIGLPAHYRLPIIPHHFGHHRLPPSASSFPPPCLSSPTYISIIGEPPPLLFTLLSTAFNRVINCLQ